MKFPFVKMNILQYIATYGSLTGYSFVKYCRNKGMDVSNGSVYPHLKALEEGGIIFSKQDGKRKVYKLTPFGEEWIKNSTNASIPKILGHSFLKLTRKFDLVDWKDREDIKELILNLDYMKSDLEKYLHTLEENEND